MQLCRRGTSSCFAAAAGHAGPAKPRRAQSCERERSKTIAVSSGHFAGRRGSAALKALLRQGLTQEELAALGGDGVEEGVGQAGVPGGRVALGRYTLKRTTWVRATRGAEAERTTQLLHRLGPRRALSSASILCVLTAMKPWNRYNHPLTALSLGVDHGQCTRETERSAHHRPATPCVSPGNPLVLVCSTH